MMPRIFKTEIKLYTIAALHDAACAHGEEMFSRYGECRPLWIVSAGHHVAWLETPWSDDIEKMATTRFITAMLEAINATAYTFICEVYVAVEQVKKGEKFDPDKMVPPSERPANERDEVLLVVTQPRGGEAITTTYLITPRTTGPNYLGPRVDNAFEHDSGISGRMFDLFKQAGMS